MPQLTPEEIATYQQDGWVRPSWRLPTEQLQTMKDALEDVLRWNPGVRPEKLMGAHLDGRIESKVKGHPAFLQLALDRDIVDAVASVIGEDVVFWGCHIFCKPPVEGYETPWHQDGHYWPIRPLATCTVWVALEPSTSDNGCLRVIPGSHKARKLYDHLQEDRPNMTLTQRMAPGTFDEQAAVDIELEPGQMSLHDVYMIHGARANLSTRRRTGVALRYLPATSWFDRTVDPNLALRPLWLAKGVDRSGKNDFVTGHDAPPATA